jgi:8-oxo-dGTP pyrophosphatase MutT (NUDIX family)
MTPKVSAKAYIVCNGLVLLMKRASDRSWRPGEYDLPGGRLEPGETPVAGLLREVREEVGMPFDASDAVEIHVPGLVQPYPDLDKRIFLLVVSGSALPDVVLSDEHVSYQWLPPVEVLDMFHHPVYEPALLYALNRGMLQ